MSDLQTLLAVGIGTWVVFLGVAAYVEHKGW